MVRLSTRVCAGLRIRVELHVTMAEEVAPAPAPKAPKKKSRKAAPSGPSAGELILKAVKASSQRKGLSYVALKRELAAAGYDVEHRGVHIKRAVKKLQVDGFLVQLTGAGASGSFRASKPVHKPRKVAPKPAKKKPASRAKKPASPKKSPVKKGGVASKTKSPSAPAKKKKEEEEGPKAPAARKVTKKVTKKKVAPPRKSPKKPLAVKAKPTSSRRTAKRK